VLGSGMHGRLGLVEGSYIQQVSSSWFPVNIFFFQVNVGDVRRTQSSSLGQSTVVMFSKSSAQLSLKCCRLL
jgi:hypothetical protein